MNLAFRKSVLFGLKTGLVISAAVTIFVTLWEWIENPGGIFHDTDGTNWNFVLDTAVSWIWPTFLYGALAGLLVHSVYMLVRKLSESEESIDEGDA